MSTLIVSTVTIVVIAAILVAVFAWFFERASRETSLVRTGIGGRKVVMDGGLLALPYFHEVARVNMQTLRLEVSRSGDAALITRDRLRVDVGVEFYVSVVPSEDGIARASQTLGQRTFQAERLRDLIEGKLIDALRAVAATMSMDELHENRGAFVGAVRDALSEALSRNGLELDSVSLTALDQTPFTALDENNAFNAVGMRELAEVIARSKKERAEIDADADVSVRRASMEATKRKLQIELEEQEAEIAQVREIEALKAAQLAEVARRKADGEREAAQARIVMEQDIRMSDIVSERAIREAEIARDRLLREAEIARERDLEIADQESRIAVAAKSREESRARAEADSARADAVKATEAIATVRQLAEAERRREVALVTARQEGQTAAERLRLSAEAERQASGDRAEAARQQADAHKHALVAEAEGRQALNEAENALSPSASSTKLELARLEALPRLAAELVKPAEKIESIRIHQISGLTGEGPAGAGGAGEKPVVNQALDSILNMAVQMPALKSLGEELGISLAEARKDRDEDES